MHKNYFGGVIVEFLSKALNWYSALPSAVMIMIGILLIGLILARLNPLKALKSSIYVAAGIVGLNALVGMFAGAIIPPLTQVIQSTGLKLDIVDLGVGSAQSFVIFPLSFYAILLVVGLAVNVMMIFLKLTDTFDVDIFNYYVWALSSAFVYALTQSIPLAVAAFVITEIVKNQLGGTISEKHLHNEAVYITARIFASAKTRTDMVNEENSETANRIYRFILDEIHRRIGCDMYSNKELADGLKTHLQASIVRVQLNILTRNSILDEIKRKFPDLFELCSEIAGEINKAFGVCFDENEVGFIALYVVAAMERIRETVLKPTSIKTVLICGYGIGTVTFLMHSLKK